MCIRDSISGIFAKSPVIAIIGLCLAAVGFVGMQPIFWTLPTEYMTGTAAAAGIGQAHAGLATARSKQDSSEGVRTEAT